MISIAGAGPNGLFAACLLAKDHDVTVFDRKKEIGKPVQCTGIVTPEIYRYVDPKPAIINKIGSIEVNSEGESLLLKLKKPELILDRTAFDRHLSCMALDKGVKILMQNNIREIGKESITVKNNEATKKFHFDRLIGADGPLSSTYHYLNPHLRRDFYKGIQLIAKGDFDPSTYKVYLGSACPDFFAWVVPEDETTARVGLATMASQKKLMKRFLESLSIRKATCIQAGMIPQYDKRTIIEKDNIFLLGDAAGHIKSSTGGGIVPGFHAAKILSETLEAGNYSDTIRKELSRDLSLHKKIRDTLNKFKDKDYDSLLRILKSEKVQKVLEVESRDNPKKLLLKLLLARPQLLSFAKKLI